MVLIHLMLQILGIIFADTENLFYFLEAIICYNDEIFHSGYKFGNWPLGTIYYEED